MNIVTKDKLLNPLIYVRSIELGGGIILRQGKGINIIHTIEGGKDVYTIEKDDLGNSGDAVNAQIYWGVSQTPSVALSVVKISPTETRDIRDFSITYDNGDGGYWFLAVPSNIDINITSGGFVYNPNVITQQDINGLDYSVYISPFKNRGEVKIVVAGVLTGTAPPPDSVPDTPVNLALTYQGNNTIQADWDTVTGATGYFIQIAKDSLFSLEVQTYNVGKNINFSFTELIAGDTYYVRVRSYNNSYNSAYTASKNMLIPQILPAVPTGLSLQIISSNAIRVSWDSILNADGYELDVAENSTFTTNLQSFDQTALQRDLTGLTKGKQYYTRVRAYNSFGVSDYATANILLVDTHPDLVVTIDSYTDTTLDMSFVTVAGAEYYDVVLAEDLAFTEGMKAFTPSASPFTATGLKQNTLYYAKYRFYKDGGFSTFSQTASFTTNYTTPVLPTSLVGTADSDTQITLTWNQVAPFTGFILEHSLDGSTGWAVIYDGTDNVAQTYTHTALAENSTHYYRVKSLNGDQSSAFTANSSATTGYTTPDQPVLTVTPNGTAMDLSWTQTGSYTGFILERSPDGATGWTEVYDGTGNTALTYSDTGLTKGQTYFYKVKALNSGTEGAYSESQSGTIATTAPGVPLNLVGAGGDTDVDLIWDVPTDNGGTAITGYKIEYKETSSGVWLVDSGNTNSTTRAYTVSGLTGNTSYDFRVSAINAVGTGSPSATETVSTVTAPSFITLSNQSVDENAAVGTVIGVFDFDGSPAPTLALSGPDAAMFSYDSPTKELRVGTTPDFEDKPVLQFTATLTNAGGSISKSFFIFVGDLPESVTEGMTLAETVVAGNTFTNFDVGGNGPFTIEFSATLNGGNGVAWEVGGSVSGIAVFVDSGFVVIGMGDGVDTKNTSDACFLTLALEDLVGSHKYTLGFKPSVDANDPMKIVAWIDDVRMPETVNGIHTTAIGTGDGGYGVIGSTGIRAGGPGVAFSGGTLDSDCKRFNGVPETF